MPERADHDAVRPAETKQAGARTTRWGCVGVKYGTAKSEKLNARQDHADDDAVAYLCLGSLGRIRL